MRIHHLSCGTMCPAPNALFHRRETPKDARQLVCHCLLIETARDGLVLVDTGLDQADLASSREQIPLFFRMLNRPQLSPARAAVTQLKALGFSPTDVQHIVLTHLDFDHAGGIWDFPWATIHVMRQEYHASREAAGFIGRRRYRPMRRDAGVRWQFYDAPRGEPWFGFDAVRALAGLPPELLLVPLPGHTVGHAGVAVQGPNSWLLHAGDAYFDILEMQPGHPDCVAGRRFYQWMMEADRSKRLQNQERLRDLIHGHGEAVRVFCSHDAVEFHAAVKRRTIKPGTSQSPDRRVSA
jgi:glyoxylase-like metal-dependent hydrolase (beta-lactamase superfamily II)